MDEAILSPFNFACFLCGQQSSGVLCKYRARCLAPIPPFTPSVAKQNPPFIHSCFTDRAHPFSELMEGCALSLKLSDHILLAWNFEVIMIFCEQESWWDWDGIYLFTEVQKSVLCFTGRWIVTCWSHPLNHFEDKIATNTQHKLYWIILCNAESFIIVVERTLTFLKEKERWVTCYRMRTV